MRHGSGSMLLAAILAAGTAPAQGQAAAKGGDDRAGDQLVCPAAAKDRGAEATAATIPAPKVTRQHFAAAGKSFDYLATTGSQVVRGDDGTPLATIGYFAYTRARPPGAPVRPVVFAFNGGPGSSSVWLHMGMLGPVHAVLNDAAPTAPAAVRLEDNPDSILDKADVVLIDPISTGTSRALCGKPERDFWTVDADVDLTARFIAAIVQERGWSLAPKYLFGESYGTIRAAAVANVLRVKHSLSLSGVILLGNAIDIEALYHDLPGNERPYPLFLPGFAAAAWFHKLVPGASEPLETFLGQARAFATGPFAAALAKGNLLTEREKAEVAEGMHRFTGLSTAYSEAADLRVTEFAFAQELLRSRGLLVSRLDARFTGAAQDRTQKLVDYDPLLAYLGPAMTAAFQSYYRDRLGGTTTTPYILLNADAGSNWTWLHRPLGVYGDPQPMVNAGVDLAQLMTQDPNMRVLVLNGYFDLGSPFSASEYMIDHLRIAPETRARIAMKYYRSGHMIYANPASLHQMSGDLEAFVAGRSG